MAAWLDVGQAADPGRVHTEGRIARVAIEEAREQVASLVGARSREVVFTSSATEAINAASWGAAAARPGGAFVLGAMEHSAVRESSGRAGAPLLEVPVDGTGRLDAGALAGLLPAYAALVHCQWGNHEVGTLQPVEDVVAVCRERGVPVHLDAAQAAGHVPVDFDGLGADLMSVSAHKFGGPPGAGALLVRRGLRLAPFIVGGEQERARRAGMENVPALVGFGAAATAVDPSMESARQRHLTDKLLAGISAMEGVRVYGDTERRLPHIVCVGVDGVEAEAVLLGLDQAGVAAHSGSSCSSESLEPSPVLQAMGVDADHSLRVSVGWSTDDADVDACLSALPGVIGRLRALGSRGAAQSGP